MATGKNKDKKNKGGLNGLPSDKNKNKGKDKGKGKGGGQKGPEGPTGKVYAGHTGATGPGQSTRQHLVDTGKKLDKDPNKPGTQTKAPGGGKGGGGGGGGDINERMFAFQKKEAERARQQEKERAEKIKKGMGKINQAFKGFDADFYAKREADYKGFYQPQLTDQFKKARENLTFALSRAGTLNSSVAGQKSAEITKDYDINTALINSKAAADRAATQGRINEEKSALVSQLNATAAANQVGNQATARTAQLASEAPDYNPLGDIFYGAAQGVGGVVQSAQNAQYMNAAGLAPRSPTLTGATTVY